MATTTYRVEVLVHNARTKTDEWKYSRPTGGEPYDYATRDEAEKMMRMTYGDPKYADRARVVECRIEAPRFVDERTQAQQRTHTVLVGGRDTFMSGWGPCENGNSYAFWACRPEHRAKVETWVRSRSEFRNIRTADGSYKPQLGKNDRCHVYVVDDNHRALWNEGEQSPAELARDE